MKKYAWAVGAAALLTVAGPAVSASAHLAEAPSIPSRVVLAASDAAPKVTVQAQAPLPRYTVVAGDTLTAIGARTHRTWQQLASYNHIANPNLIYVGDVEVIPPATYEAGPESLPTIPAYTPPVVHHYTAPVTHYVAPAVTYTPRPAPVVSSYAAPGSSFESCVEFRESTDGKGSSNLYGILPSTWASLGLGGSPYSASPAQQQAAFNQLYARDGASPWAAYDGC